MKYTVDLNDRPVYLQIYRQLRADIVGRGVRLREQTAVKAAARGRAWGEHDNDRTRI